MVAETQEVVAARLLGFDAAASYLNLNLQTVRRLIERGILQPVRIPTLRRVLFDRKDLDNLIEAGKAVQTPTDYSMSLVTTEIGGHAEA
jgi:excisionase family DNA binding protein